MCHEANLRAWLAPTKTSLLPSSSNRSEGLHRRLRVLAKFLLPSRVHLVSLLLERSKAPLASSCVFAYSMTSSLRKVAELASHLKWIVSGDVSSESLDAPVSSTQARIYTTECIRSLAERPVAPNLYIHICRCSRQDAAHHGLPVRNASIEEHG